MSASVYILDDDAPVRTSVESLLRSVGLAVTALDTGRAFLELALDPSVPCCLVLDVRLRGSSGLELQSELNARGIRIPIVFITGHGDVAMSVAAMKAGALEFLTKPFRDQDLLDAVHRGLEADRRQIAQAEQVSAILDRYNSLTSREQEVMLLATQGLLNKQIAAELMLSEVTVKVHRARAMQKMAARSLPELVRLADGIAAASPKP